MLYEYWVPGMSLSFNIVMVATCFLVTIVTEKVRGVEPGVTAVMVKDTVVGVPVGTPASNSEDEVILVALAPAFAVVGPHIAFAKLGASGAVKYSPGGRFLSMVNVIGVLRAIF